MAIAVVTGDMNVSLGPFSTAQQLSSALNRNELSAEELLMATVERIEAVTPPSTPSSRWTWMPPGRRQGKAMRGARQMPSAGPSTAYR